MSHEYVRTHLQRVRSIQRQVAVVARLPTSDSRAFDEEETYSDLSDFLLRSGLDTEAVVQEVLSFTLALAKCRAACPSQEADHPEARAPTDEHDASPHDHGSSGSEDGSELNLQQGTYF